MTSINEFKDLIDQPKPTVSTLPTRLTMDEAIDMSLLYSTEKRDKGEVLVTKTGKLLKSGIRPLYPHEEATYVVDYLDQTCSCEGFTRRHKQGICKHVLYVNALQYYKAI